ncbi:MAG: CheR family methyltransferase [Cyanophyceae cyanobacterium]
MNTNEEDQVFESLLEFLREKRGFDFTGYKRSSIKRRITRQMQRQQIDSFGDYLDYLQVRPDEFLPLFNTILINVTSFFRDAEAWTYLQTHVLPNLLRERRDTQPIRIWSAGCASGEEAYTLAILFSEELGIEDCRQRVKIYATDVDEEALSEARHASYSTEALETISPELQERYFERQGERWAFRADLRRSVIFGRHDLVQDAPISRLDLLVCRNTLMYFNAETQGRILNRFHFALNDTGFLFLGKAEMLLTHSDLFTPINLQHRIFRTVPTDNERRRIASLTRNALSQRQEREERLRELAFNAVSLAQLVVDVNGTLILVNEVAQSTFNISPQALNQPIRDLEISYRPLDLRSKCDQILSDRQPIRVQNVVRYLPDGKLQYLDVQFTPLQEESGVLLGISITFVDVSRYHDLNEELQQANQELETANEELQSSNEELETTNEELQSTNEELETTNEELQSTNEELETMNEELQSTNEELQTINDELRQRTTELNQTNAFLNSILTSLQAGVVVVNRQFNILSWNVEAENLWGLRTDEVRGQSFLGLDIGLPVQQLRDPIRLCLDGREARQVIELEAINRRGQTIQCRVTITPLIDQLQEHIGVILMMESV